MGFEITFLGASGGPIEGTTCSVLLKPDDITYGDIITNSLGDDLVCIDAGSGLFALTELIAQQQSQNGHNRLLKCYNDSMALENYCQAQITEPLAEFCSSEVNSFKLSSDIFKSIQTYLITHPHMDHIAALVINSAGFDKHNPRNVYGSHYTIGALEKHIFNGIIWPNLAKENMIRLHKREFWESFTINKGRYDTKMFDLSHGEYHDEMNSSQIHSHASSNEAQHKEAYISSAFFITDTFKKESILIFGDFESDQRSGLSKNKKIWEYVAPVIATNDSSLKAIVLECSNCTTTSELYGHLMPMHLITELMTLRDICRSINSELLHPLRNFHIIINHIKDIPGSSNDPRQKIMNELNELNRKEDLGVKFSIALSGISFIV